jgi:glutamate synthase (NADPH/NADH) small chain
MRELQVPGADHPGVVDALKFIEGYKTGNRLAVGRRVVVVGAGNTAIDAARAALRLGAEEAHIVYRRVASSMSAFVFEYEYAKQEGVKFHWWLRPEAILTSDDREKIRALRCMRVEQSESGELRSFSAGGEVEIACDMIIPAIGQMPLLKLLQACRGVRLDEGRVAFDRETGRTCNAKYFAGGDCVNGGREVVDAVADGKRTAISVARLLEGKYGKQ